MAITNHDPASARMLPAGAVFHRCAFQVNPHHYGSTFRGQTVTGDKVGPSPGKSGDVLVTPVLSDLP